jgi:hypothetical protein
MRCAGEETFKRKPRVSFEQENQKAIQSECSQEADLAPKRTAVDRASRQWQSKERQTGDHQNEIHRAVRCGLGDDEEQDQQSTAA